MDSMVTGKVSTQSHPVAMLAHGEIQGLHYYPSLSFKQNSAIGLARSPSYKICRITPHVNWAQFAIPCCSMKMSAYCLSSLVLPKTILGHHINIFLLDLLYLVFHTLYKT